MAQKPNKTVPTETSVQSVLEAVEPPGRRDDARAMCAIMERISGEPPAMWGPSIIGFGVRAYRTESGREGEICRIGFAPRRPAMVLYGLAAAAAVDGVEALGKVTTGKGCLYVKSLKDVDLERLEAVIARAVSESV